MSNSVGTATRTAFGPTIQHWVRREGSGGGAVCRGTGRLLRGLVKPGSSGDQGGGVAAGPAEPIIGSRTIGSDAARPEPPLTLTSLRSARAPSLCDHPAGQLSKGVRKGNERNGEVQLDGQLTRFGAVVPGRPNGAATVFHCSQGGSAGRTTCRADAGESNGSGYDE